MKKILYHFRTTFMLGLAIFANLHFQISNNIINADVGLPIALSSDDPNDDAVTSEKSENSETSSTIPPLTENFVPKHDLLIKAFNPGYTVDGTRDVGEFIELQKIPDASISLAGYSLQYTNSSGTSTTLLSFSEGSIMAGESLLLRLARTSSDGQSDATYMTTIAASAGTLKLFYEDVTIDEVCWGKTGCYTAFKSTKPTSLVRDFTTGLFDHDETYSPAYNPEQPSLILPELPPDEPDEDSPPVSSACYGLTFSEIFSYYANDQSEQFIEFYNSTDHAISLTGCQLRYKNKTYALSGEINPNQYFAYYPSRGDPSFSLTKNPSTSNLVELLEADGQVIDVLTYNHGQKKNTSYALFFDSSGDTTWQLTYALTPGSENTFQEFQTCPAGKVINPATGNCVKATSTSGTLAACPEGKYRNPLTGRCKNIESSSTELKPCAEGYERNPETNRCRKVSSTNDGAGYALVPTTYSGKTNFVALSIVILLVSVGSVYIVLQFRREIARATRKAIKRIHHIQKDLVARGIGPHRHKKP